MALPKHQRSNAPGWGVGDHTFLMYSIVDYQVFPDPVSQISISLRLFLVCPVVAWLIWASYQELARSPISVVVSGGLPADRTGVVPDDLCRACATVLDALRWALAAVDGDTFVWHAFLAHRERFLLTLPLYAGSNFYPFPSEELR